MKSLLQFRSFILIILLSFSFVNYSLSQESFIGTKILYEGGKILYQTLPEKNTSSPELMNDHLYGQSPLNPGEQFAFGGNVLWWTDDQGTAAIANFNEINYTGEKALTAWGLNQMRVSLYSDQNNIPLWQYPTLPYDAHTDISEEGDRIAVAAGPNIYVLDTSGIEVFNLALPDSFYASVAGINASGFYAVFLVNAFGNSNTARIYYIDLNFTPIVKTFDVPVNEIGNWTGVNFSNLNDKMVVNGRNHIYVFNILGTNFELIWDRFLDNTEAPAVISGDGNVIVTADNSGFIQTWAFDEPNEEYYLLWQYRVPAGTFTNWGSSVNISADGSTIIAGTLLFFTSGYDGSVIAFDTYGDGTPKWVFSGAGDLVDDIAISHDGKIAAAVTWGDLSHTKPDLLIFDVETGQVTYEVITPGSFFSCDISYDGKRVFAGGKAVHAREFGNGGRIYLVEVDLGGGHVSGDIDLTNVTNDSEVIVKAGGTTRTAVTDVNGNYTIQNIPPGTYTITAEKVGYNFGEVANVVVAEDSTSSSINMSLDPFTGQPPVLTASGNLVNEILLSWTALLSNKEREIEIARMVGDDLSPGIFSSSTQSVNGSELSNPEFSELVLNGADSIAVYKSLVSGGPYNRITAVPSTANSYTDSNVVPLRDYYYVITLFNDIGESVYSNEALGRVSDTLLTFDFDVPQGTIPTIDGVLSPGEWSDAFKFDVSDVFGYGSGSPKPQGSVFIYLKYDDNTDMLYVAGEDFLNPTLNDNEGFGLYFDDNNNNVFDSNPPFIQEGNFWAYWHPGGADLRFRDLTTFAITPLAGAEVAFTDGSGHLQGEVAIPMGFIEGYQLQVFGPDKAPGLGAFLIARQPDQTAIFNGWWPQTMNSLFNPLYFGDVGINVSLDAPPQAPSDITVERQGQDLLITWSDPVSGLNNDPLPSPPIIHIYKNDEFWQSVSAGTESLLDEDVYCPGWYEYQFKASILVGPDTLTGPISAPVGNFACEEPVLSPISYDDDEWDGFYVVDFTWDDNKFAVRFTPQSYPAVVRRIETLVNSNDDFNFTVQADNGGFPGDTLAGPYTVASTDAPIVSTVIKTLPGLDPPQISEGDFWVLINWHMDSPGAPGIGVDSDPPNNGRGMFHLASTGWQSATFGNIMITSYVSDTPVGMEDEHSSGLPLTFDLKQNYPNPFNPSTIISYQIPGNEFVTLEVYNMLGQKVKTLINQNQEAGYYSVEWDGRNNFGNPVSSGIYLYRIKAGNFISVHKMTLLR